MRKIRFGTAYYPEYMPYDRVDKDLQMMKQAGMNTVRIGESTWSTLEPREGVYCFSYIDRVLAAAEREGMEVIVGTPTYAIPPWLVKKEPEVMVLTQKGPRKYGHRQQMDILNPVFLSAAENIIRRLISHAADHPCVAGYQIDNETKHYGSFSPIVQELFLADLKERFQTPEAFNRAFGLAYWSNAIGSWEEFPDLTGCVHAGLMGEFDAFRRNLAAEYLEWQAGIVSEYKREDQFVTHNLDFAWKKFGADIAQDGYSYGIQPDMNHVRAASALTLAGTDIYHPTQDSLTGAEISFGGDEIRCLKRDFYLVLECQAQAFKYWTPYPGQLRLHAYSHLAGGALGMLYWNWHSIHNGYETYWKGILSHDLQSNEPYREICHIGKELEGLGFDRLCIKKKNRAAILVDNRSLKALEWFPIDRDLSYNDVVRWIYDSLYEMNIECDVVFPENLCEEQYHLILVPALYSVQEDLIVRLKSFVRKGGVLLSTFKSFVADSRLNVYHAPLPYGMTGCFGMCYQMHTCPGRARVLGQNAQYMAELLIPETAEILAAYEHPCWSRYAAVTRNHFGQGYAYYVASYTSKEILKQILERAAGDARIERPEAVWPLIVKRGVNHLGREVVYLLNYSAGRAAFVWPCGQAEDITGSKKYGKGDKIYLEGWGTAVLEIREEPERQEKKQYENGNP